MNSHFGAVVGRMECGCQDEGDGGKLWDAMRCSRFLFSGVESVGTGSCGICGTLRRKLSEKLAWAELSNLCQKNLTWI